MAKKGQNLINKILRWIMSNIRIVIAAVCVVIIVIVVVTLVRRGLAAGDSESEVVIVSAESSSVRHLSFPQLSLEKGEGKLSVSEFSQILDKLYEEDYVLVDVYDLAEVSADGIMSLNEQISLPEGKKPLIISQRDVSFPFWNIGNGYAEKLILNTAGDVKCVYTDSSGDTHQGDYDLIPYLESFIKTHPDFSYEGAKGIIGVTGYAGVLGYRTSGYLASASTNYFGVEYDVEAERASASEIARTLVNDGWHFACCGFNITSYGSEPSIMKADLDTWMADVSDVVGGTDIIIFPKQTDVGSWAPYSDTNIKYNYLKDYGIKYFFIHETETPWFIQCTNAFLRQAIYEIDDYAGFERALAAA